MPSSAAPADAGAHAALRADARSRSSTTYLNDDPSSLDFNLNLYCNGEAETVAGLLTFDENLNAVADWAETCKPNEDASVWTFNIRPDNTGWSNGDP